MGVQIETQTDDDLNKTDSFEWKILLKSIVNNKSRFKLDIFLNILIFQRFLFNFKMFFTLAYRSNYEDCLEIYLLYHLCLRL